MDYIKSFIKLSDIISILLLMSIPILNHLKISKRMKNLLSMMLLMVISWISLTNATHLNALYFLIVMMLNIYLFSMARNTVEKINSLLILFLLSSSLSVNWIRDFKMLFTYRSVVTIIVAILLMIVIPKLSNRVFTQSNQEVVNKNNKAGLKANFFDVIIKGPIEEELIFTAGIFTYLYQYTNLAFLITAIIFALPHIVLTFKHSGKKAFRLMPKYIMMSVVLTSSYAISQSLCVSIVIHMLNNLMFLMDV